MTTLVITCGLPASGKTTWARVWVASDPDNRVRLNRDDFRTMMLGGWTGRDDHEAAVTAAQHAALTALLAAGWSVVCDDTNLRPGFVETFERIAAAADAWFEVLDLTGVPVETCIDRDAVRNARGERYVGEQVIREMHAQYLAEPDAA